MLRVDKRIPLTDIPIRHFQAMLKKDALLWIRSWRRMAFEIFFPVMIFVVIAIIRINIPIQIEVSNQMLENHMIPLSSLPTPERIGIAGWSDPNKTVGENTTLTEK